MFLYVDLNRLVVRPHLPLRLSSSPVLMPFHADETTALSASQPSKAFSLSDRSVLHREAGMPSHFAYYCSGHGFGHATRVIAVTQELLVQGHSVSIVTNAPERIFTSVLQAGATYRNADIDAGICQPKAYDVDRRKTIDGLRAFLARRGDKIAAEVQWCVSFRSFPEMKCTDYEAQAASNACSCSH